MNAHLAPVGALIVGLGLGYLLGVIIAVSVMRRSS